MKSIRGFVEELARHVREVRLSLSMGPLSVSWTRLAEDIFSHLEGRVVGLDEAQELPSNYALRLFKKIWDTYDVRLVFTGSMMGLLQRLLEPGPSSPLYGRQPARITLRPFTREQSLGFLRKGFEECGVRVRETELEEAVERLDGYPGWLTYYGNARCIRGMSHVEAISHVYSEGKQVLLEELKHFLSARHNPHLYLRLLRLLPATWSQLLRALQVNPKTLRNTLMSLEGAMIIEKIGSTYTITDPVMRVLVYELQ